jgi:exosortase F-associated protein
MKENNFRFSDKLLLIMGVGGVTLTYLLQDFAFINLLVSNDVARFVLRKGFRVLLNDLSMLAILFSLFKDKSFRKLAIIIQLLDSFVFLPVYLVFKISLEGTSEISSPILSQFHRIIVNPTLMILLIPAFYLQKLRRPHE